MKKLSIVLLSVLLLIVFVGCDLSVETMGKMGKNLAGTDKKYIANIIQQTAPETAVIKTEGDTKTIAGSNFSISTSEGKGSISIAGEPVDVPPALQTAINKVLTNSEFSSIILPTDISDIVLGVKSGSNSETIKTELKKKAEGDSLKAAQGTVTLVNAMLDEVQKADEFYQKLMYLNPTHSDLHAYGAYLVRHKRFSEGFKFLQHRFQKEDLNNVAFPQLLTTKKKKWNMKVNIKDKHVLVHFEQGFGDSIMFVRFLDELKKQCKEVSLVVQNSLISLFNDSKLGVNIYSEDQIPTINYDYWIPMMDLPIVCETQPDSIPKAGGYLRVPKSKINAYRKEHINDNDKIKIGIAYEGTLASKETDRDIPLSYLYPLMKLPDVEVYSFQVDDLTRQMDMVPQDAQLIRLGKTFKNWEDTACAMNCMDLMVTTDNGVMNLAGALGVKTFGIFNRIVEWRWFKTEGNDIAWYKSIKPFQCPTSGEWETPVKNILEEIDKMRCKKIAEKIKGKI